MNYLISKGVQSSRISSEGFGETKPVAENPKAAGRALNRRVSNYTIGKWIADIKKQCISITFFVVLFLS